jgi:hypothetical protein
MIFYYKPVTANEDIKSTYLKSCSLLSLNVFIIIAAMLTLLLDLKSCSLLSLNVFIIIAAMLTLLLDLKSCSLLSLNLFIIIAAMLTLLLEKSSIVQDKHCLNVLY